MNKHATEDIRNIAFIGGPGSGKTTLVESILYAAGAISRLGSVEDGTTVSDHEPDEKEKQHSLRLGVLHADHKGTRLHLLDAPGYPDFVGEAAAGLAVAETAMLCVAANHGLTFPDRKIWELAGRTGRARCIVVTKFDQGEVDLPAYAAEMGEALGVRCLPVVLPDGSGAKLSKVRAVGLGQGGDPELEPLRSALVEAAVEVDEEAMTRFLEDDQPPSEDEACALLRRSLVSGDVVPVLAVSASKGLGVPELLQFAVKILPSPAAGPYFKDGEGQPVLPDAPGATAFVFKTIIDPFVGKMCLMRVVSGQLHGGSSLKIARTGKNEKLAHLQVMQGKDHTEVPEAVAGDLVAVSKVDELETSDTLVDPAHERSLQPMVLPKPMAARAIEPVNHADEIKLNTALRRIAVEDPSFHFERNEHTHQLVIWGMSLMHLETQLKRIKDRAHVEVTVSVPKVALKETVTGKADGHHRHKKQTGGRGQFAEVYLAVEPAERGAGLVFEDDTVGGSIPKQYIPAVHKGIDDILKKGIIAGYPVVDVVVRLKDGKHHDVDSDEASFKMAGARAFKDAFVKARPVLLEPLVDVEVAIPSRFMGTITSDMTGRRGHISGMDAMGDIQIVKARVPQREVMTYPTALHSMTSGEGSFTLEFHDYEVVPPNVQQEIMAEFKPKDEED